MKIFILFFILLSITACTPQHGGDQPTKQASIEGAFEREDIIGLDVRTLAEVKTNPSPGAKHIPLSKLKDKLSDLDKNKHILVFCEAGGRADQAKKILNENNFEKVENIKDWRAWNQRRK